MNEEEARLQEQVQELLRRAVKAKRQAEAISPENKNADTQQPELPLHRIGSEMDGRPRPTAQRNCTEALPSSADPRARIPVLDLL